MSFSVKFSPFLMSLGATGTYGLEGEFINSEPSKKPNGSPYEFSDISVVGNHYFIDMEGKIFTIVFKNINGANGFPYIELNNLLGQNFTPQLADGIISIINPITMQFYLTSAASKSLKAKIQRINVRDLIVAGGSGVNIYNADGTLNENRVLTLGDSQLTFKDGPSEISFNKDVFNLVGVNIETTNSIIQHSADGSRWSQHTTNIGSTVKTKL
jgi:hypothetical protein